MVDISYLELTKMVDFFYNMSYDDDIPEETEQETVPCISPLQLHARMFALGDRYDIAGLREAAVKKYSSRCATAWMPLEFLESISDLYERTPASIRNYAMQLAFWLERIYQRCSTMNPLQLFMKRSLLSSLTLRGIC